jgi:ABC-type transporter Mla maintaining outer membrane lipid asymmetry ATPase subunit MlaF
MKEQTTNAAPPMPIEMLGVDIGTMQDADIIVIRDIKWSVAGGEFWVVGAPQGSGKSDFLMTAAGLMPPVGGCYKFYGNETRIFDESRLSDRLRLGFVFENAQLFHYLTIAENVALPLRYNKNLGADEAVEAIDELLELMELKPLADVRPANLPRSWHKRASLARALTLRPEVLLTDNPLHALDARHSSWWLRLLDDLVRGHKWLGDKPLTVVTTTDNFRPWRGSQRRFALLKEKHFVTVGSWNDVVSLNEPLANELSATPVEDPIEPLNR